MALPQSPGWYDDPDNPQQLRYFDGVVWTRHTSPRSTRPTPGYAAGPPPQGSLPSQPAPGAQPPPWPPQQPTGPQQYGQQGPQRYGQYGQQQYGQQGQQPYGPQGGWSAPPAPTAYGVLARTPDGEPLAGWWKRLLARLIDWVIVWLGSLPLTGYFLYRAASELTPAFNRYIDEIEAGNTGATPPTVTADVMKWVVAYTVVLSLVAIAYEVFFTTRSGATPGKKALGLRVRLREHPGPLPLQAALTRTVIPMGGNLLSSLPLVSTLVALLQLGDGLLPLVNERKQALHDLMAKTNVVDTRKY
jgi:uncharacterized RDD family membrane protein YckC